MDSRRVASCSLCPVPPQNGREPGGSDFSLVDALVDEVQLHVDVRDVAQIQQVPFDYAQGRLSLRSG